MTGPDRLVRFGILKKKPDWDEARFRHHWVEVHGRLAARLAGLRGYQQHHVVDREQRCSDLPHGPEQFDGFSQLWFDDDAAMRAAVATDLGRSLVADEAHFIGDLRIAIVRARDVVAHADGESPVKRMSLIRRRAAVSAERFRHAWQDVHAPLVAALPGIRGYRQNLIVERQMPKGRTVDYDVMPLDGIAELWFDSTDALAAAFASAEGRRAVAHARDFMGEITTFLVETRVIVAAQGTRGAAQPSPPVGAAPAPCR